MASLGDGDAGTCVTSRSGGVWAGGDNASLWRLTGTRFEEVVSFHDAPSRADWHLAIAPTPANS